MTALSLATLGVQCDDARALSMATLGVFCIEVGEVGAPGKKRHILPNGMVIYGTEADVRNILAQTNVRLEEVAPEVIEAKGPVVAEIQAENPLQTPPENAQNAPTLADDVFSTVRVMDDEEAILAILMAYMNLE